MLITWLAITVLLIFVVGTLRKAQSLSSELKKEEKRIDRLIKITNTLSLPCKFQRGDIAYLSHSYKKVTVVDVYLEIDDYYRLEPHWRITVDENVNPLGQPPKYTVDMVQLLTEAQYKELKSKLCKSENK